MISNELTNFGLQLLVVWLVWRSYRNSIFIPAQKYSTFWPRFWTGLVDNCVQWPLGFALSMLLLLRLPPVLAVLLQLSASAIGLAYTIWMHTWRGQTVGKIVCKVRVVDNHSEGPISVRQAFLREFVPLVANLGVVGYMLFLIGSGALIGEGRAHLDQAINWQVFGPLALVSASWFLIEVITMFSNRKRRALHDLIAGTTVVRTHLAAA